VERVTTWTAGPVDEQAVRFRLGVQWVVALIGGLAVVFGPAGRLDWGRGWLLVALLVGGWLAQRVAVAWWVESEVVADQDGAWLAWVCGLVVVVVAGLDLRFQWAPLTSWAVAAGVAIHLAGQALIAWALAERARHPGQPQLTTGPWATMRHPITTGVALILVSLAMVLGSGWALIPAGLGASWVVLRTYLDAG